jgi:shikimate dehydrogenase
MQNAALNAHGHALQYVRIHVTPQALSDALRALPQAGFLGINLTIPHKQATLHFVDELSQEARLMGAINTVAIRDGKLHGYNTDGPGFAAAIKEVFGVELGSLRVLILGGAGGAGRAITVQCALAGCPQIVIANRNSKKGENLASEIQSELGQNIMAISMDPSEVMAAVSSSDLIVNATPLGMKTQDASPLPEGSEKALSGHHLVYDTVYSGGSTALLRQAQEAGARSANGLTMLLHQGALANEIWFRESAPLETMRDSLKATNSK